MSLATRCSACATVFRVAQDQLKVSEGWVRCGRCNTVFNALEGLFDLGREQPGDAPASERVASEALAAAPPSASAASTPAATTHAPSPSAPVPPSPGSPAAPVHASPTDGDDGDEDEDDQDDVRPPASAGPGPIYGIPPSATDALLADPIDAHLFRKRGADSDKSPAVQVDERDRLEFSDARFDSDLFAESPSSLDTTLVEVSTTDAGALPLESSSQQPDFLRRAERRSRWRSRPRRLALATLSTIAALLLAAQVAGHFRDAMAAQWPALRPLLVAGCRIAGCTVEAPRRIDDVSVESSSLSRAIGLDAFVLSVTLRSRSRLALMTPSIDLSLTDGNGRLVARRVLSPRDLGAAAVLPAGAEAALQVMLGAGSYRVAGYTVEIFYP